MCSTRRQLHPLATKGVGNEEYKDKDEEEEEDDRVRGDEEDDDCLRRWFPLPSSYVLCCEIFIHLRQRA